MVMKCCWENRTELEKCLLLIIAVTVPTLCLYISLYLHYNGIKYNIDTNVDGMLTDISSGNYIFANPNSFNKEFLKPCECLKMNCTKKIKPNEFIISISEKIYEDDPNDYKFKCLAMLLSNNYIMTFTNCLSKNISLNIRGLSNNWSLGGYTRRISHYNHVNNISSISKLSEPLPSNVKFINVMELNLHELTNNTKLEVYRWKSKFNSTLKRRFKYDKLVQIQLNATKCTDDYNFYGFCTQEVKDAYSNEDILERDPIFLAGSNMLIGMEIKRLIFNDTIEHYYQFTRKNM